MVLSMCLFAGGCGGVEPEKRIYPLALGVDLDEKKNYVFTYGMPDMMRATGQDKAGEEGVGSLTVSGSSFSEIEQVYRRSQGKYLDLGHLQILVLGNSMLERENWEAPGRLSAAGALCRGTDLRISGRKRPEGCKLEIRYRKLSRSNGYRGSWKITSGTEDLMGSLCGTFIMIFIQEKD